MIDTPLSFHERESQVAPPVRSGEFSNLIARLEAATGPDRGIDLDIARMLGVTVMRMDEENVAREHTYHHYTWIIDSALTLVPQSYFWRIDSHDPKAWVYRNWYDAFSATAATPANALCIAALRARAATSMTAQAEEQSPLSRETK